MQKSLVYNLTFVLCGLFLAITVTLLIGLVLAQQSSGALNTLAAIGNNLPVLSLVFMLLLLPFVVSVFLFIRSQRQIRQLESFAQNELGRVGDLKNLNEQYKRLEETLSDAIASLPDGFVLYDENDRLVLCNEKYRDYYKTSADLLMPGVKFEEIIRTGVERGQYVDAKNDPEGWIKARLHLHGSSTEPVEQQLDDGRWLRIFERPTKQGGVVGFRVDITELKRREFALIAQETQLRATIESALDAIIILDTNGTILEFNPAAEVIFGYERSECVGKEMSKLIVPDRHVAAHKAGMDRFRETGVGRILGQRVTVEACRKDGSEITIELAINPAESEGKTIFVGYMRDITQELLRKQALEEAKEAAEQASRSKAAFLAVMSHEIRTPLNGLLGLLELIDAASKNEKVKIYANTALESANALAVLLNDILEYTKVEAGKVPLKRTHFELQPFASGTVDLMRSMAFEKELMLMLEVENDLPDYIFEDNVRLRQIILNLISNAIKFTDQGSVFVRFKKELMDNVEHLIVAVEDTGAGIEAEFLPMLFEQFGTAGHDYKENQRGTGLGLSISRGLAELLGGSLTAGSELGKGSCFTLSIPLVAGAADVAETPQIEELVPPPEDFAKCRILLAEDNPTNNLVMSDMLEGLGIEVTSVTNGHDALTTLENENIDLAILDISMPEMDGIELAEHIRKRVDKHSLPLLAHTAYTQAEDVRTFLSAGYNAVLKKPTRRTELIDILQRYLLEQSPSNTAVKESETETLNSPFGGLIDQDLIDDLFRQASPSIRQELQQNCLNDLSTHVAGIEKAVNEVNEADLRKHAHTIKGVAGTFGLLQLAAEAGEISHRDENVQIDNIFKKATGVVCTARDTQDALKAIFNRSHYAIDTTHETEKGSL